VNYWKVILATVVIFGAGVFTGGLMVDSVQHSHTRNNNPRRQSTNGEARPLAEAHELQSRTNNLASLSRPPRPPEILDANFVQQLDDKLQLTPDQRVSIQKIIADGQERNHSIWTNNSAQMRAVVQDVRHRVRETLTADQQKQFEDLMKRAPRRQGSTNAPTGLLAPPPPLTGSNLSPEFQAIMTEAEHINAQQGTNPPSNILPPLSPEVQAVMIEAERLRVQRGTNPPSMILPPTPMGSPPAPAN
jgi:hypothetical protein